MFDNFLALPLLSHVCLAGVIGLMVGSFLNVVIYRYPKKLHFEWTQQSYEWLHKKPYEVQEGETPPTLSKPASHCFHCKAPVQIWQNIPVISYLFLRGKCANCKTPISLRYPLVELLTGLLSAYVIYALGATTQGAFAVLLTWGLVTLSFIDFDHHLLPDDIVLTFMWLGLGLNIYSTYTTIEDAVIGAIAGYLSFWVVFQAYLLITKKEAMGHGDFKLMALLGAWFGWQYLPQIILISTLLGSIVGISMMLFNNAKRDNEIPFGPYIALAGFIAMLWGDTLNQAYLLRMGL